ncbi:Mediator of RNA polymerase II transcription subunit 27 [Zea mays]|uniref:Mediator of RNA polymerase II transcription subunit 27 n=1 Tax=Zea mays TaxID=4577 RepID=A0A1D6NF64_MAIZE|nr:Mediator of RNA polymerase II transcription subunit 27 [Zea mays]
MNHDAAASSLYGLLGRPPAHASALAVAHPHDPAGGDAPPKQVAQAMERLGRAGRLIADIRLGADRLLEALFVSGDAPPYSVRQHVDRMEHIIVKEDAAMRLHFQDLRALGRKLVTVVWNCFALGLGLITLHTKICHGRQLEESGVLNGALKARGNSWGLHMPLVCPDGAVVAYAWKRQLAGQAGASAVDRTRCAQVFYNFELTHAFRLALKAFTDQKRRFFPHLEDEVVSHLHDGEPGGTKKPKLFTSNGDLEEKSLSDILKNLEHEASNIKIFTYWHLDWSKRASSLASLLDDDFVDPSKELNLQNMGKSRSGALTTSIDQVAVIELLVPSVFRAVVSLHPAGSTDPDAVAFFSPTERWIASYQTLFTKVCSKCGRLLMMDKSLALLLPPVHRPYHQTSNIGPDLQEAYHIGCSSYDG